MARPLVAIVGRPNVGKSTFFNKISGKRISIVEDTPGVTRDRIYADVEWMGRKFTLIDTGGIDPHSEDVLLGQMRRQAEIAMDTADVICFFTDARSGLTQDDDAVANLLRKTHKPLLLVVMQSCLDLCLQEQMKLQVKLKFSKDVSSRLIVVWVQSPQ